ncbi:MAG: Crp/Fnr family transcriptional regulator [Parvibaculum sp.]
MTGLFDFGVPGLMSTLPTHLAKAVDEAAVRMSFRDGQQIHTRGDGVQSLSIIRSGSARLGYVNQGGEYRATAILGPGQFFGEFTIFAGLPREFDATAVGPTVINEVSLLRLDRLIELHRGLRKHFLSSLAFRLHAALEFVDDLRRLPLAVRAAKVLSFAALSDATQGVVSMTQSELAEILGVTRASANKALKQLEAQKLVTRAYGQISLPDQRRLRNWIAMQSDTPTAF